MRSRFKKMMDYCTYCPKMCRFSCPVSEATQKETYTPWGKMQIGRWLTDKSLVLSRENALALYQCTNCLHCQEYCEHLNDVPEALREVRKIAVENYVAPPEAYQVEKNFSDFNNPYEVDLTRKLEAGKFRSYFHPTATVLLFPSCHTLRFFPDRISTYFALFDKLNIRHVTLFKGMMPCCGEPLRSLGFQDGFEEIAEVQYYAMKNYQYVVTDGPECCNSFKSHYKDVNIDLSEKMLHLMEFLEPFLKHSNYRIQGKVKGRIAYHDPSHLSRYLGLSDLPRRILSEFLGVFPLELNMSREDSLSSGAEGSYEMILPQVSDQIARRTTEEVASRGIKKLLTACAEAEVKFRQFAKNFEVQDFYEFLNENISVD